MKRNPLAVVDSPRMLNLPAGIAPSLNGMGLVFDKDLPKDIYRQFIGTLTKIKDRSQIFIGDAINSYEADHGEKYQDTEWSDDYKQQTLENFAWVARSVQNSRRREVSFEHHKLVAKLEPSQQEEWLTISEKQNLSKRDLALSIKAGKIVRIVDIEGLAPKAEKGVVTLDGILAYFIKWSAEKTALAPIQDWDADHRAKIKADLRPIVEFYEAL